MVSGIEMLYIWASSLLIHEFGHTKSCLMSWSNFRIIASKHGHVSLLKLASNELFAVHHCQWGLILIQESTWSPPTNLCGICNWLWANWFNSMRQLADELITICGWSLSHLYACLRNWTLHHWCKGMSTHVLLYKGWTGEKCLVTDKTVIPSPLRISNVLL